MMKENKSFKNLELMKEYVLKEVKNFNEEISEEMLRYPGKLDNYLSFNKGSKSYICVAREFNWAHKTNNSYWQLKDCSGSYDKGKVYYLDSVCWLETRFIFFHVKPGYYDLFIHELFTKKSMENQMNVTIMINEKEILKINKFPSEGIISIHKENHNLIEDLIYFIDKTQFKEVIPDEHGDFNIQVQYFHKKDWWKGGGWYIDGGRLL